MNIKPPKGYKKGKAKKLSNCCRDIRIWGPYKIGEVLEGINTTTEQTEKVMVIKESPKPYDMDKVIVVELKK